MTDNWKNRIIGYELVPVNQLQAHPYNARRHPVKQREALRGSLDTLGWIAPVIINQQTGYCIDGHARIEEALTQDENQTLPVVYVDLNENEEAQALASYDFITYLAEYDRDNLDALLQDVQSDDSRVQVLLSELAEDNGLYFGDEPIVPDAPDAQIDRAEELNQTWQVKRGDLWIIPSVTGDGEHRLLCGDSTVDDDVRRVLDGEKTHMMFTDPPYGVDYDGGHFNPNRSKLVGDHNTDLYGSFLPLINKWVDGACYMFFADSKGYEVYKSIHDNNFEIHALIIWHKTNATYAAMNAQYKQRHEPCLYFKPKDSTLRWCGASTENTLWEIKRDPVNHLHPTQKPVELSFKAINNHLTNTVFDPFGGGGAVMVACEQLSRQCRMIEIEPKYCAVILQRMTDMGCEPRRIDNLDT